MSNVFHCVEDEEHIKKTDWRDVKAILRFARHYGFSMPDELLERAKVIILDQLGHAEAHQFGHEYAEWQLNEIHAGRPFNSSFVNCLGLDSSLDFKYDIYMRIVETTNKCGRNKYKTISKKEFKRLFDA